MAIVDERANVPPLDAGALRRFAAASDRDGVVAAMLIGSRARASAGPCTAGLEPELSERLGDAVGMRNLDDLRRFAAFAQGQIV